MSIQKEKERMNTKYLPRDFNSDLTVKQNKHNKTVAYACLTENIGLIGYGFRTNDPDMVDNALIRARVFLDVIATHAKCGVYGRPAYE